MIRRTRDFREFNKHRRGEVPAVSLPFIDALIAALDGGLKPKQLKLLVRVAVEAVGLLKEHDSATVYKRTDDILRWKAREVPTPHKH